VWEGERVTDGQNETIPERLLTLVRLDAEQPVQQPSMEFSPDRWVERAPDHADVFTELPGLLEGGARASQRAARSASPAAASDRASVRGFCDQQACDDVGANEDELRKSDDLLREATRTAGDLFHQRPDVGRSVRMGRCREQHPRYSLQRSRPRARTS